MFAFAESSRFTLSGHALLSGQSTCPISELRLLRRPSLPLRDVVEIYRVPIEPRAHAGRCMWLAAQSIVPDHHFRNAAASLAFVSEDDAALCALHRIEAGCVPLATKRLFGFQLQVADVTPFRSGPMLD